MRRASVVAALAIAGALAVKKHAAPPRPAPSPAAPSEIKVVEGSDGRRFDMTWDGPLLGWALPRDKSGARTLYALVGPAPAPPSSPMCSIEAESGTKEPPSARLFRWRVASGGTLELIGSSIPQGTLEAADLDGDGEDELLLLREREIDEIRLGATSDAKTSLVSVVAEEGIDPIPYDPRNDATTLTTPDAALRVVTPGELRTFRRKDQGRIVESPTIALPVEIDSRAGRIVVRTRPLATLGRPKSGGLVLATWPETVDNQRLRTTVVLPDAEPDDRTLESWLKLPNPERPLDMAFALLDGRPALVVLTISAEKLSLFGEKMLRIYRLAPDRTRTGLAPLLATTSGLNLWQAAYPIVLDLDHDGHDDLTIGYWKGLKNTIAALEVRHAEPDGTFAKPHTTEIEVEDGARGFLSFGLDADGDGRPDLILLTRKEALVFPGTGSATERPVLKTPSRRVALPDGFAPPHSVSLDLGLGGFSVERLGATLGTPLPVDLDADGQVELVFAGNREAEGRGAVTVVAFRRPNGGRTAAPSPLASRSAISYK